MRRFAYLLVVMLAVACRPAAKPIVDAGVTIPPPTIASLNPNSGWNSGGTAVTISGANFQAGAAVYFADVAARSVTFVSASTLAVITPAGTVGAASVTVINPDQQKVTLANGYTYVLAPNTIGSCQLLTTTATVTGSTPVTLQASVFVSGVTSAVGQGPGTRMQAGVGSSLGSGFLWQDAAYAGDNGTSDTYQVTLTEPPGVYSTAFRAEINGCVWTYCEVDGPHASLTTSALGSLTVKPTGAAWCGMDAPLAASGYFQDPVSVLGEVYIPNLTGPSGPAAGVTMQAGVGPLDAGAFQWFPTQYLDAGGPYGNNDLYGATLSMPAPGQYGVYLRVSVNDGGWSYCGLGAFGPGILLPDAGRLDVAAATLNGCNIQYPESCDSGMPAYGGCGATSFPAGSGPTYYGQVYVAAQSGTVYRGVVGELGLGPLGSAPADGGGWTFYPAVRNPGYVPSSTNHNNEFMLALPFAQDQQDAVAFRFSGDGRQTWTYCDQAWDSRDGGFNAADISQLNLFSNPDYEACAVAPASLTATGGTAVLQGWVEALGRGQVPVTAQALVGPPGTDPGAPYAGWTAFPASYASGDVADGGSWWSATVSLDAGSYATAFRFSIDGGQWSYAGVDGGCAHGFQLGAEGAVLFP